MADYYRQTPINYRSGATPIEEALTSRVDAIRKRLAEFIGSSSKKEVVFTKNTTEGINVVASGMRWSPGDEVILTPIEHQSNLIPWMRLAAQKDVKLKYVTPSNYGVIDADAVRDLMTDRTKLVSIHHVSNLFGTIQDIKAIAAVVHERDALMFVDAAQSEGRLDVSVQELGCDFLACCARKGLMGPQGIGFLWGRQQLLEELNPLAIGGQAAEAVDPTAYKSLELPYLHEAGILNTAGVIGLGAALDYITRTGLGQIRTHIQILTDFLIAELRQIKGVRIYSPSDASQQAGIVCWNVTGQDSKRIAEELYQRAAIVCAAGSSGSPLALKFLQIDSVLRTSFHCFNDHSEVETLVDTLKQII